MRIVPTAVAAVLSLAGAAGAHADAAAGRTKAGACATCHGPLGLSTLVDAPHLAGQPEVYLVEQLKAYRSGRRMHHVMNVVAKPLSDTDIAELAAWYSSIAVEVREKK